MKQQLAEEQRKAQKAAAEAARIAQAAKKAELEAERRR